MEGDAELLRRSARDPEAFGELFDRHADAVLRYLRRHVPCADTAKDLLSETFAKAYVGRRSFRGTASARGWLLGIARHELYRLYRQRAVDDRARRRLGLEPGVVADDLDASDERIDRRSLENELMVGLKALPHDLAAAVVLRVGHDLSYQDIASRLGCSIGAARVRVHRGLKQLRAAQLSQLTEGTFS